MNSNWLTYRNFKKKEDKKDEKLKKAAWYIFSIQLYLERTTILCSASIVSLDWTNLTASTTARTSDGRFWVDIHVVTWYTETLCQLSLFAKYKLQYMCLYSTYVSNYKLEIYKTNILYEPLFARIYCNGMEIWLIDYIVFYAV